MDGGRGPGQRGALHPRDTTGEVGDDRADAISETRVPGTVDGDLKERRRGVDGNHLGAGEGAGEREGHAAGAGSGIDDAVDFAGSREQIAQPASRLGEPPCVEVGASGEPRAHPLEVDVVRAVVVVTGHGLIVPAPVVGVRSVDDDGRVSVRRLAHERFPPLSARPPQPPT
jgi:hypothetical protein